MFINLVIKFLKSFILKYFGVVAIEKIVIILIRELVKSTDSKVDDEIYEALFGKLSGEAKKEN